MPAIHRRTFLRLSAAAWASTTAGQANAAPTYLGGVNVRDYGATGDGTSDDTAAIHAARDASGVGGKIAIPRGTYLVSGLTAGIAKQTWELSKDAVIKMKAGAAEILLISAAGVSIIGGVFDGSSGAGVFNGSNSTQRPGSQNGIRSLGSGFTIRNATIQNVALYGISAFNSSQVTIANCTVRNSAGPAIWVRNSLMSPSEISDIAITDNLVDNAPGGQYASGIGFFSDDLNQRINRVLVSGNSIRLPYDQTTEITGGIGLYNSTDFVVTNNFCSGGFISISCPNARQGKISSNTARGFSYVGIELPVHPPGEVNSVSVIGNLLDPDGVSADAGIQTSANGHSALSSGPTGGISNLSILGNTIRNFTDGCNLINFGSGSVCSSISIVGNTLTSAVRSGRFAAVTFNGNITGFSMSKNSVDGSSTVDSCGVLFLRSASDIIVQANQFANLSVAAILLESRERRDALDHIKVVGNRVLNCGAIVKNSTTNGAIVGTNIFTN